MYDFYDYMEKDPVAEIEYVKGMYDAQVHKVKQEEYMKNLLFADYIRKVKVHRSRYDYVNIFRDAQSQIGKKKKKEREQLETIESFIKEDFLSDCRFFKIINIFSCGYDGYAWRVEFQGYGQTFYISIPVMDKITTKNFEYANNGMFVFAIQEPECCWSVKKMSYKIEDIAEYIKEYFELDKVDED